jgi:integrase
MKLRLDAKTIAALELPSGKAEEIYWDLDLEGFGFRLRQRHDHVPRGTWVAQYRAGGGRTRRVTLGPSAKLIATEARTAARRILAEATLGNDPQGAKVVKRQQTARVFRSVAETYLDTKASEWRPSSQRINRLYLLGPYFKALHALGIGDISHPDVAACLTTITRRNSAVTAAAARRAVSAFFSWSAAEGLMGRNPINPVIGTRQPAVFKPRDCVLSDTELAAVWRACRDDEFGRIVRLLILLGSRRQEVGGMCWSELDLAMGTWRLPSERSKNHHAHTLALPPAALEIITAIPRQVGRDYLFGFRGTRGFVGWSIGKAHLDARLNGSVQPFRLHDLRRTVATRMADIGILPHTIEAALNHQSGHKSGISGIYSRSLYEREVKAALLVWSEHVLALVEGRNSKVVTMRA